jgi:serine/threonine protein kinase
MSSPLEEIKVLGPLARGAQAMVFRAEHTGTGEAFALKVVDKAREGFRAQRSLTERALHSSFRHRHVVALAAHF